MLPDAVRLVVDALVSVVCPDTASVVAVVVASVEVPVTVSVVPTVVAPVVVSVVNEGVAERLMVLDDHERLEPSAIRVDGVVKKEDHSVDDAVSGTL